MYKLNFKKNGNSKRLNIYWKNLPTSLNFARLAFKSSLTSAFLFRFISDDELSQYLWNSFSLSHFPRWWFSLLQLLLLPQPTSLWFKLILMIISLTQRGCFTLDSGHRDYLVFANVNPRWRTSTTTSMSLKSWFTRKITWIYLRFRLKNCKNNSP